MDPATAANYIATGVLAAVLVVQGLQSHRSGKDNRDTIASVERRVATQGKEIETLQTEIERKDDKIRAQQTRIDGLVEDNRRTDGVAREVDRTNAELRGRLSEQRDLLMRQLSDQAGQITDLKAQSLQALAEVTLRDARITELTTKLRDMEQSMTAKDTQIAADLQTIAGLEDELKTAATSAANELNTLKDRVDKLEKDVEKMTQERDALIAERDAARAERDKAVAERDELKTRVEQLTAELVQVRSTAKVEVETAKPPTLPTLAPVPAASEAPKSAKRVKGGV